MSEELHRSDSEKNEVTIKLNSKELRALEMGTTVPKWYDRTRYVLKPNEPASYDSRYTVQIDPERLRDGEDLSILIDLEDRGEPNIDLTVTYNEQRY